MTDSTHLPGPLASRMETVLAPLTAVRQPLEKPPVCHPCTVAIFHTLTHGPSYRALDWPTSGGAR
ncbi:hypothetical protein ABZ723_25535 [Streptomyces sp. NPDC006700]|uniref:hypothetical protein n=1 Tax=unclassified Streptomyces TaxID=2593676 RepID=UPI0033DBA1C1